MKKKIYTLLLLFIFMIMSQNIFSEKNSPAYNDYLAAQKILKSKDYNESISAYNKIVTNYPDSIYAGEALFKIAVIFDEKLINPPEAIKKYEEYIKLFKGRNSKRAEVRIKALIKYKNVSLRVYREYINIMKDHAQKKDNLYLTKMEEFIKNNSTVIFLDDALLWLANEYKGFKRKIEKKEEFQNLEKAMVIFKKIIKDYKKGKSRIIALKNLGDCYQMKGNDKEAMKYYEMTIIEGGDFGKIIVGKYIKISNQKLKRNQFLYIVIPALLLSMSLIIYILPVKEFSIKGLKRGLIHSLFFLPGGIFFTSLIFYLTDASTDNNTGKEPYIVLIIMITTLFIIIFNGIILEAEERAKIRYQYYIPLLITLILSLNYIIFHQLKFLQIIEGLII